MFTQIKLVTTEYAGGRKVDQVRIWIASVPFHCDLSPYSERMAARIARELDLELIDHRDSTMNADHRSQPNH